jgi:hypothetical protein
MSQLQTTKAFAHVLRLLDSREQLTGGIMTIRLNRHNPLAGSGNTVDIDTGGSASAPIVRTAAQDASAD